MDVRWVSDGCKLCQIGVECVPDGCQLGVKWVSNGCQMGALVAQPDHVHLHLRLSVRVHLIWARLVFLLSCYLLN